MDTRRKVSLSGDCATWGEYELIRQFVCVEKENEDSKTTLAKTFSIGQWDVSVSNFSTYVDKNLHHVRKIRKGWRKFFVDPAIKKSLMKNIGIAAPRFAEYMKYVDKYEMKRQNFEGFCDEIKERFRMFQNVMTDKKGDKETFDSMDTNQCQSWNEESGDKDKHTSSTWSIWSQQEDTKELGKQENH